MSVFEHIISYIAPHDCISCGTVGSLLCVACQTDSYLNDEVCYICRQPSPASRTCCSVSALQSVTSIASYGGVARQLVWQLKFNRARDAARTIAIMCDTYFSAPDDTLVTHVPTANSRVRLRGYDQAQLIARTYALRQRIPCTTLLARQTNVRQVGASSEQRRQQLRDGFRVISKERVINTKILLIDDVITTGSSLESCAETLLKAGAREVSALVFARA